ncbi:hydroquinone glucosyltransferase-like [Cajanus cajan]|uniref:Glycosyltransferase n=1 Tax=Cajanus cajan TaxID=3821 RepID=A0A151RBU9_CAJCA|nr:hydroquinone glucosyltransferase-like [Cajanus cajan]KYP40080.1 Hydroquinone glucosyltransferase [Cajanus cajan]
MAKTTHIVVIAGPGFTHLVPILQFSKRLVNLHPNFHVTCIIPSLGSPPSASKTILETLPSNITSTFLPPVSPKDLPQGVANEVQMQLTVTHSLPSIHQTLKSLTSDSDTALVAMVVDSFAFEALDFAQEFNLLSYVYFPAAATTLSVLMHLPKLDEETSCEYRDLPYPVKVPGCVPLHGKDLYTPTQDRTNLVYKLLLQRVKRYRFVDGIFINSFLEMEEGPIAALKDEIRGYPRMYPVGPIVQTGTGKSEKGLECLTWLDKQEKGSVLYVSFGSGGTLSQEQMNELAHGLEMSKHKFLWAVRAPNDVANAAYLGGGEKCVDPLEFLPFGFMERTKEQGMVVPSWAPQVQILGHGSVGGFLTHCGWNSTLESVLQGVPLITWPLFAEQKMNAVVLSESLRVGVRPRANEKGLVERDEISDVVKRLMEGVEGVKFRNRMKELKEAATNTLKEDGASTKTLSQLALKWKSLA